jgi:hypothetical protein
MANMSYCKFENTYKDLMQCYDGMDIANSQSEQRYRKRLIELCRDIVDDFGDHEFDTDGAEDE